MWVYWMGVGLDCWPEVRVALILRIANNKGLHYNEHITSDPDNNPDWQILLRLKKDLSS